MNACLAIDIVASSGRHIVGWEEDGQVKTEEVYRFQNGIVEQDGHYVWPLEQLSHEVIEDIRHAFSRHPHIQSLSVDTWGVDYVPMNGEEIISPCYAYRDSRTDRSIDKVHALIPMEELYRKNGVQFQPYRLR